MMKPAAIRAWLIFSLISVLASRTSVRKRFVTWFKTSENSAGMEAEVGAAVVVLRSSTIALSRRSIGRHPGRARHPAGGARAGRAGGARPAGRTELPVVARPGAGGPGLARARPVAPTFGAAVLAIERAVAIERPVTAFHRAVALAAAIEEARDQE